LNVRDAIDDLGLLTYTGIIGRVFRTTFL
jgi:hypothetical protein